MHWLSTKKYIPPVAIELLVRTVRGGIYIAEYYIHDDRPNELMVQTLLCRDNDTPIVDYELLTREVSHFLIPDAVEIEE